MSNHLKPLSFLEAIAQTDGESLTELLPTCVGTRIDDDIVTTDIVSDFFIELGFELTDAVKMIFRVVRIARMRGSTEVITLDTAFLHPFNDFPLHEVARAVRDFISEAGAILVKSFAAEEHTICRGHDSTLVFGKKEAPVARTSKAFPKGSVVVIATE